jgi:transposase InsO family protein
VATWAGFVYVAFVLDAFSRRILDWKAATSMRTELVLDTLEMAIWIRQQAGISDLSGLIHCSSGCSSRWPWGRSSGCALTSEAAHRAGGAPWAVRCSGGSPCLR